MHKLVHCLSHCGMYIFLKMFFAVWNGFLKRLSFHTRLCLIYGERLFCHYRFVMEVMTCFFSLPLRGRVRPSFFFFFLYLLCFHVCEGIFFPPFVLLSFKNGFSLCVYGNCDLTGPVYLYVVISALGLCSVLLCYV